MVLATDIAESSITLPHVLRPVFRVTLQRQEFALITFFLTTGLARKDKKRGRPIWKAISCLEFPQAIQVVAVIDLGLHRRVDHDASKGIASLATKWPWAWCFEFGRGAFLKWNPNEVFCRWFYYHFTSPFPLSSHDFSPNSNLFICPSFWLVEANILLVVCIAMLLNVIDYQTSPLKFLTFELLYASQQPLRISKAAAAQRSGPRTWEFQGYQKSF